jgi:hypothetical protein
MPSNPNLQACSNTVAPSSSVCSLNTMPAVEPAKGDEPFVLARMRQDLRVRYGEFAETVLGFVLRTYQHGGVEGLLQLATRAAA